MSLFNISSTLTPLNTCTLRSDLSHFPQPIAPAVDNNGQTPMASPAKTHSAICNDCFCPTHDGTHHSNCPLINTAVSSCQSSPAPFIRCRGKKRVRHYHDSEEVKRKRLTNAEKKGSSRKKL